MYLEPVIKIAAVIGGLMTAAAYLVLLERWMAAWIQDRVGPNRVGLPLTSIRLWGLGQPLADGLKFILKEEYTPKHVDQRMFLLAPISILAAALAVFAVIPFGSVVSVGESQFRLVVAPGVDVGMIVVFALSSIAVYGVILGGWASNNKYSFLGGLRSSAQLIAYELPLGLGILGVVVVSQSLDLEQIMAQQAETGVWNAFAQPLGFVVFMVAAFAEAARLPFDLPECEQELIGGYHTEYSGIKLLLFLVAEFLHMIAGSFLIVILFLGGWHLPGLGGAEEASLLVTLLRIGAFFTKIFVVILFFMVVRWSWPRFRFDQLMGLAWKVMLPLGVLNFLAVAIIDFGRSVFEPQSPAAPWNLIVVLGGWAVLAAGWYLTSRFSPDLDGELSRRPGGVLGDSANAQL